ncbi:MAG: hypothetical protein ABFD50_08190 [Smithella sp.]
MTDGKLENGLYRTFEPTITQWNHGEVKERIVIPSGQTTNFSSIPEKGLMGWIAKKLGFVKTDPWFTRSGKIHDELYNALKHFKGYLPDGWYQFFNPVKNEWEPVLNYQWNRQQADAIWRRISIEDGCTEKVADRGYKFLRVFGGLHMLLT